MARKSSTKSGELFIGESGQLRLADKSAEQQTMENRKVECLGMTFANDQERRKYFTEKLRERLTHSDFTAIDGFPSGKHEDILALSDPPYYTACPNPWIPEFLQQNGTNTDPRQPYHREPFAADVSEGKNHPIYNAHSYHTKVPHRAIMRYILHYTDPGDVVVDGFCGTGMTGVAAQLCGDRDEVQALGYRVQEDGTVIDEAGTPFSRLGARRAVINDLSPAATFISHCYNRPAPIEEFDTQTRRMLAEVQREYAWLYETVHTDGKTKGRINYTIWSQVFSCAECGADVVFWDVAVDLDHGKVRDEFPCPECNAQQTKRTLQPKTTSFFDKHLGQVVQQAVYVPALIKYSVGKKRYDKRADANDIALAARIADVATQWCPTLRMPEGGEARRNDDAGITHVHHFYTPRSLIVLSALRAFGTRHWAPFSALTPRATRMHRIAASRLGGEKEGVGGATVGVIAGTLYVPSLSVEMNVFDQAAERIQTFGRAHFRHRDSVIITTQSSTGLAALPDASVDYMFIDPPFGSNLMYSELNFLWEAWLGVITNNKLEAVEDKATHKTLDHYRQLMTACFAVMFRKLKPGRWLTIEFSNSRAEVWNSIQTALQEAGFVVANVSALDKQQGSFKAVTTPTAVKQDLVISAYKPNGGLEERFARRDAWADGVWDFVRTHLKYLPVVKAKGRQMEPIAERDARILYDRMVAFYVGHGRPVPMNSGEFQSLLAEKFPERDGMFFLPEQVNEYDRKRAQLAPLGQMSVFVDDERSAIEWLRKFLKERPSPYQDVQPEYMQQIGAAWKKWEQQPDLHELLDQNFLCYDGQGEVPSQIHSYLSTQFKELRNLPKDHKQLREKGRDRWYVPNTSRQGDLDKLREKRLLRVFDDYRNTATKKLKVFRIEALRAGFKIAYDAKDYKTIVNVAAKLPDAVLQEDEQLLMYYDVASMRLGEE